MATTFTAPQDCIGVEMPDGTKYNSDRDGHIQVDNPRHEAQIAGSLPAQRHLIHDRGWRFERSAGVDCPKCGFSGFAWQAGRQCPRPRCDGVFPELNPNLGDQL